MAKPKEEAQPLRSPLEEGKEQGFIGVKADPTPNEHYTIAGVTQGLPTPETDDQAKADAVAHGIAISRDPFDKKD